MIHILAAQMAALLLAWVNIGVADLLYHGGRIAARFHSLWVSFSIAAMCLPVVGWVVTVFVGAGAPGRILVGAIEAALFLALYHNLRNLPAVRKLGHGLPPPPPPAETARPPTSG